MATPGTETPSALEMARNCVAAVSAAADFQASDDPEKQLLAHVHHVGAQGDQASKVAARLAAVSIAEDLHFLIRDGEEAQAAVARIKAVIGPDPLAVSSGLEYERLYNQVREILYG